MDYEQDWWRCACGRSGRGRGGVDAGDRARAHCEHESQVLMARLVPEQLAALLAAGAAGDSAQGAAVGLLTAHGHWMGYGYLRRFVSLRWSGGVAVAEVGWHRLRGALDEAAQAFEVLERLADAPRPAIAGLQDWLEHRDAPRVAGSSSELAVLRLAVSLVTGYRLSLYEDLGCLDNTNRGYALTAIGHLLSHGGNVAFTAQRTWQAGGAR